MSSESPVIDVCNLWKIYDIYKSPGDRFLGLMGLIKNGSKESFEAVSDVSMQLKKGEVVGIVGRNGSGKSTLLQLIAGILQPTQGSITHTGRISAILELGAGFNPEATGRENVYINSAILGYSADAIDQKMSSIIAFADIGVFIDRQVKLYSSGMYVRLAFAIAISVEPDILIVDEALSVGDAAFQRKCFARIDSLKRMGTTILFVSHSETLVVELCDRAVLLNAGKLICEGKPKFVMGLYNRILNANEASLPDTLAAIETDIEAHSVEVDTSETNSPKEDSDDKSFLDPNLISKSAIAYEPNGARIINPKIFDDDGNHVNILVRGNTYVYTYEVHFDRSLQGVRFSFLIKTISGLEIGGVASNNSSGAVDSFEAGASVVVSFRFNCLLKSNQYFLNAGVLAKIDGDEIFAHRILDLYMFSVQPVEEDTVTGVVDFRSENFYKMEYLNQRPSD
jgi:lipopolysaccharide transport system ATP-binding protein